MSDRHARWLAIVSLLLLVSMLVFGDFEDFGRSLEGEPRDPCTGLFLLQPPECRQ